MNKKLHFLGLPFECGQERPGLSDSFQFIREQLAEMGHDEGTVSTPLTAGSTKIYQDQDIPLRIDLLAYENAYKKIQTLYGDDRMILNWGGDHSVGLSTVGAFINAHPNGRVLWIDAHADLNLPVASLTGNFHGMPVSVLLNLSGIQKNFPWMKTSLRPEQLIYLGLRDLDPFERQTLRELKIQNYNMQDIRERGISIIAHEISSFVGIQPLHVSFDIDSVDPSEAPATGLPVPGGLTSADLQILSRALLPTMDLRSMDVVEINPRLGSNEEVQKTYFTALQFLKSLFQQGGSYGWNRWSTQKKHEASLESCL